MKYIQILIASVILSVLTIGCKNGNTVTEDTFNFENTFCDLYLDLGCGSDGLFVINDSNLYPYLDTVCMLLSEANPKQSMDYYHHLITDAREKEPPRRCLLVEKKIPYKVWLGIYSLPGWNRCVIKVVDGKSVITGEEVKIKNDVPWLP